mmetsp:Transcript_34633/g.74858  ORF Transcript_34633/g.74858 Transcript_34633/m.74858 type:complete len:253 (+) Transcript_34633:501-1259(+)
MSRSCRHRLGETRCICRRRRGTNHRPLSPRRHSSARSRSACCVRTSPARLANGWPFCTRHRRRRLAEWYGSRSAPYRRWSRCRNTRTPRTPSPRPPRSPLCRRITAPRSRVAECSAALSPTLSPTPRLRDRRRSGRRGDVSHHGGRGGRRQPRRLSLSRRSSTHCPRRRDAHAICCSCRSARRPNGNRRSRMPRRELSPRRRRPSPFSRQRRGRSGPSRTAAVHRRRKRRTASPCRRSGRRRSGRCHRPRCV